MSGNFPESSRKTCKSDAPFNPITRLNMKSVLTHVNIDLDLVCLWLLKRYKEKRAYKT